MLVPSPSTRWVVSNQFRRRPTGPMNRARGHEETALRPTENGSRGVPERRLGGQAGLIAPARPRTLPADLSTGGGTMELDGKVALVTGASGGIGAAVSRRLHDAGAAVRMISRRGNAPPHVHTESRSGRGARRTTPSSRACSAPTRSPTSSCSGHAPTGHANPDDQLPPDGRAILGLMPGPLRRRKVIPAARPPA